MFDLKNCKILLKYTICISNFTQLNGIYIYEGYKTRKASSILSWLSSYRVIILLILFFLRFHLLLLTHIIIQTGLEL
jgi:hypothetical protein